MVTKISAVVDHTRDGRKSTTTVDLLKTVGVYTAEDRAAHLRHGAALDKVIRFTIQSNGKPVATAIYTDKGVTIAYTGEKGTTVRKPASNVRTNFQLTVREILGHIGAIKEDRSSTNRSSSTARVNALAAEVAKLTGKTPAQVLKGLEKPAPKGKPKTRKPKAPPAPKDVPPASE